MDDNVYNHDLIKHKLDSIKDKFSISQENIVKADNISKINSVKVGRNDHCPCGSGKKYKRCCAMSISVSIKSAFLLPLHDSESSRRWLPKFLESYIKTEAINKASLYILCNGDTNWTAEVEQTINALYRNIPNIYTIPCGSNLGFPKAINFGIKYLLNQNKKFEYVGFLNSDLSFYSNWFDSMMSSLSNPGVGGTGFCARAYDLNNERVVGWLEFSCVLFKSRAIINDSTVVTGQDGKVSEVNCLDPIFGMGYFEDDSLCLKLIMDGWKLNIVQQQLVIHHVHQSTPDYVKKISDNYKVFVNKWSNVNNAIVQEYLKEQHKFFSERCPWIINPNLIEASNDSEKI
jgi:hypothetical protein